MDRDRIIESKLAFAFEMGSSHVDPPILFFEVTKHAQHFVLAAGYHGPHHRRIFLRNREADSPAQLAGRQAPGELAPLLPSIGAAPDAVDGSAGLDAGIYGI